MPLTRVIESVGRHLAQRASTVKDVNPKRSSTTAPTERIRRPPTEPLTFDEIQELWAD